MYTEALTIIGCGAQAKYAMEILNRTGGRVSRILDPIGRKVGKRIGDCMIEPLQKRIFLEREAKNGEKGCAIICCSDNRLKCHLFKSLGDKTEFVNIIHPESTIASTATLGKCNIVNAGAVIQPYARIGNGCMIHAGVVIEHDDVIDDFVNIAPGATLAGGVRVGEGTTVFSGTVVVPNVQIGKYAVVGAGSVVLHNVPDDVLVHGNPARVIRKLSS